MVPSWAQIENQLTIDTIYALVKRKINVAYHKSNLGYSKSPWNPCHLYDWKIRNIEDFLRSDQGTNAKRNENVHLDKSLGQLQC